MRIVLWSGLCVVVLILGVIVIGSLLPRRHLASRSASFHTTPEKLYALIEGTQSWRPDVSNSVIVSDSGGAELMRETTRDGKIVMYEVSDRLPPVSLKRRIASTDLPYSGTWTYFLKSEHGMTVVRITEDGEVGNPIFRFVSRFIVGHTRTMDQYLKALGIATGQDVTITSSIL